MTIEMAYADMDQAAKKVERLLNSVKDDATAKAAAVPLRQAGAELATASKQLRTTVAALEAAGQHQQIVQFYQNVGNELVKKGQELANLRGAIERVVKSPQGPTLRSEINTVLDAMVENASVRERDSLQRWIQEKNLRQ
jgi:hypothetical protein